MLVKDILELKNTKLINGDENKKIDHFSINTNDTYKNTMFIPLLGNTDGHEYILDGVNNGIIGFFVTPNHDEIIDKALKINKHLIIIEVNNSLKILQTLAAKVRNSITVPVIALTGSFGKTSQREMINSVLKQKYKVLSTKRNYNNHIGMPITLLNYQDEDIILLELGSNHLGEIDFLREIAKPTITLITHIGSAHIEYFKNIRNIFTEKTSIAKGSKYFFRNNDDEKIKKFKPKNTTIIDYSINDENIANIIYSDKTRYTVTINDKRYKVTINSDMRYLINYSICAMKIGLLLEMDIKSIIKGISEFKQAEGRMEKIKKDGYTIINDCYNASYETMVSGLDYFYQENYPNKIVILGDLLELGGKSKKIHKEVAKHIIKNNLAFKEIHLVGPYMKVVYNILKKHNFNVFYYENVEKVNENIMTDKSVYLKSSHDIGLFKLISK